jgi:proteic killer suppression protein
MATWSLLSMIAGFADRGTQDIYDGADTKAARKTLPKELWNVARRKLDMLAAAHNIADLKVPPNNHLEKLKKQYDGKYSIRINDQWRIVFAFASGTASEVLIVDYH